MGRFSLPAGVTFDTSFITVDGTLTGSAGPYGTGLGNGFMSSNIVGGVGAGNKVIPYAFDSTNFGLYPDNSGTATTRFGPGLDFSSLGPSGSGITVTLIAPIL